MKLRIFILLYFACSIHALGQESNGIDVNVQQQYFWMLQDDYVIKKDFKNILLDSFYIQNSVPKSKLKIISKKNTPYIVSSGGGMVWKIINDTFVRIDKSYFHKMTSKSSVFVHRDTIFKFGGYGYWSSRNFFSYFSETSNHWEYYPINPQSILPPGLFDMDTSYASDRYFVSGGSTVNRHTGTTSRTNNVIWRFDFDSKSWSDLGISKFFDYKAYDFIDIGQHRHLATTFSDEMLSPSNYILDFNENLMIPIQNSFDFSIANSFHKSDSIFTLEDDKLKKRSLSSFIILDKRAKPLYMDSISLSKGLSSVVIVIMLLMIIFLLFLYSKNKQRPKLSDSGFRFQRVHYPLSVKEHKVLSLMVHNKTVDSKALLQAIYDSNLSPPQNNRIKLEVINSLNKKLAKVLDVNKFVRSKKSSKDQRMLIYFSNHRKDFVL